MLKTKNVYFAITNLCTLKCKLCSACIPDYKKYEHVSLEQIKKDIDNIFLIYENIENVDISGGEPLLHPELPQIVEYMAKYNSNIGSIRIITNATIAPSEELINVMKKNNIMFIIDDYGELSVNKDKMMLLAEENNIKVRINRYCGDEQHFNGWVDYGDLSFRGYNEAELKNIFDSCLMSQHMCLTVKNGKLYQCMRSLIVETLIENGNDDEHVIELDGDLSIEEKIKKAANFGKLVIKACNHCNGFDPDNSKRYPAAEQIN